MSAKIKAKYWKWFGSAGHFCGSERCQFHLCTQVGGWLVSTIGEYVPCGLKGWREIGPGRLYETMVFRIDGKCDCGCGLPSFTAAEIDGRGYNDAADANAGHMETCRKWANCDPATVDDGI